MYVGLDSRDHVRYSLTLNELKGGENFVLHFGPHHPGSVRLKAVDSRASTARSGSVETGVELAGIQSMAKGSNTDMLSGLPVAPFATLIDSAIAGTE